MAQEIIVTIIGIAVCSLLIYKLYKFFFVKNEGGSSCGCSSCHCHASKKSR